MNRLKSISEFGFTSCRKNVIVTSTFILLLITSSAHAQLLNDYPEVALPKPEMVHEPAGANIKLKCEVNLCNNKNNIFKWEFKACDPDLPEKPKCQNSEISPWMHIPEKRIDYCTSTHFIKKSTGNNSGLYRCSVKQSDSEEVKFVKMYQVHVVVPYHVKIGPKPKLLDIQPINITVIENLKIVIQCKVFSDFILPPQIWWLKHVDSFTPYNKSSVIHYTHNNKTYLKLKSSQMATANSTYVSKLIIEKSSENDTGVYTCVALNLYGNSTKDVYVDVIALEKDWQGTTSFSILFLIPLGFALIPISGWLCVHYYRKKKLRKLQYENKMRSEIYKYQPMLNRYNLNRHNRILHSTSQGIV